MALGALEGKLAKHRFIPVDLPLNPWSSAHCASLGQRLPLARFWVAAPEDLLASLFASPLGDATRQMVRQLTPQYVFTAEEVSFRNALNLRLQTGLQAPLAPQLMLANWLFSPPGLMKISNPQANLPPWLLQPYLELYEAGSSASSFQNPVLSATAQRPEIALPEPDFGVFPASIEELVSNRIQLNRMLGLSNLYYIDPEDQEILQELQQLRLEFARAIQICPEHQLQQFWATDLGERYWSLVRSGVQKEPLSRDDDALKQAATRVLQPSQGGGFGTPGAVNAFLVAMLYYQPGSMKVDAAEHKLPAWLLPAYKQIFAEPLAQV